MIGKTISHYKILEKLGEGGMGVVYKAEDTKLKREVAIKFLPRQITASDEERERFKVEAQAAAALNHPNIATIHNIEEVDDEIFIVMEYIDGEELKDKIDSPLGIDDTLDISTQIAKGLQAAHDKGVTHRDIKSANIMLTEKGDVKIMDFGLAKMRGGAKLTLEQSTLGTAPYMSPEQARGEEVDHRSDIFSLGVLLYEMLTGQLPFKGDYEQAITYSILNEDQEPITALRSGIPMELERVVNKCLQKEPSSRYQHADELLVDLQALQKTSESGLSSTQTTAVGTGFKPASTRRMPVLIGGLAVLALLVVAAFFIFKAPPPDIIDSKSIAVMPFENMNEDESEYFSDGITEDIITQLSKINDLSVVSRSTTMRYKNTDKTPQEIGTELHVATLLEGSIRRAGDQVRITAQLIDTRTDKHLWAESYDRDMQDIFAIQSDVAQSIARALKAKLTPTEKDRIQKRPTKNIEAYNLYLQGRYFWARRHQGGLQKALEFFQQAIAKDPDYALGHAGVADCYGILTVYGYIDPKIGIPKAKNAALKAIEFDKMLAEPHASLAWCTLIYDWDLTGAEKRFEHAIELNPRYAPAHYWYSLNLAVMGKFDEAIAEGERAVELEPQSLVANFILGNDYYFARQYDRAFEQLHRTLEMDPNYVPANLYLGRAYLATADYEEAIQTLQKAVSLSGGAPLFIGYLGAAYAMAGQIDKAQQMLNELRKLSNSRYVSPYYSALIYYGLNDLDRTFEWLENAYTAREPYLAWFRVEPVFDGLRQDPRYDALVKKIGLD